MVNKIILVRHPSGIKRTVQCVGSMTFGDLFQSVSKQFGLDSEKHELKLGPETVNMNVIVEASKLPDTAVLDIAPKTDGWRDPTAPQVFVKLCFADEANQYECYSKVMNATDSLWNVIEELVPSHMTFVDEDISLAYLQITFKGKRRMAGVKLEELCGIESRLYFTCCRDYLRKPYNRNVKDNNSALLTCNKKRREKHVESLVRVESVDGNVIEYEKLKLVPTVGNFNPDVIELSERQGKIHKKFSFDLEGEKDVSGFQLSNNTFEQDNIVIRIVFTNKIMFEGLFHIGEAIGDVKKFLNRYLLDGAKNYYLYTIRPRLIADPKRKLETMRSNPPGYLWYSGKRDDPIFTRDIEMSLKGQVFTYISRDGSERSQIRVASSSYMWCSQADKGYEERSS